MSGTAPIVYRPCLDYEGELGLLLNRDQPDRFGFLMANDLTDRSIQVMAYDRHHPAPGFTRSKSFPGALRVGPLLAIGGQDDWEHLEMTVKLNGTIRQRITPGECRLTPRQVHQDLFSEDTDAPWLLALTGTPGGTLLHRPTPLRKLRLLVMSGFSALKAKTRFLVATRFLRSGDCLELASPTLGIARSRVLSDDG